MFISDLIDLLIRVKKDNGDLRVVGLKNLFISVSLEEGDTVLRFPKEEDES